MKALTKIKSIRDFLIDSSEDGLSDILVNKYSVDLDRVSEIEDLLFAFLKGEVSLDSIPDFIEKAFGVSSTQAKLISADLAGYRLLPLQKFVPGVTKQIQAWGGKLEDYPKNVIERAELMPDFIASRVLTENNIDLPETLQKRYNFLAEQFLSGEKDHEWMMEFLVRDISIGGLEISKEAAVNLVKALEVEKKEVHAEFGDNIGKESVVDLVPEKELTLEAIEALEKKMDALNVSARKAKLKKSISELPKPLVTSKESMGLTLEDLDILQAKLDAIEIENSIGEKAVKKVRSMPLKIDGDLISKEEQKEAANHAVARRPKVGLTKKQESALDTLWPSFKRKRISRIAMQDFVKTYLVGMRSERQIEGLLRDRYKFDGAQIEQVMKILKEVKQTVDTSQIQKRKDNLQDLEGIQKMEREVINKRYAAMTKKANDLSPAPSSEPSGQVSAARTKKEELKLQGENVNEEEFEKAVQASKPEPVKPKLSKQSVPPTRTKQRITDITFEPQLIGPVEELGTMTVEDFKRLGSSPEEAIHKLQDRIEGLAEISQSQRIQGILAWRKSPVYGVYRSMMQQSLSSGESMAEVAANRRNKGEESLTPAEVKALVKVNQSLQF